MAEVALSSASFVRPHKCPWGAFPTRTMQPISTATIYLGQVLGLNFTGSTNVGQVIPAAQPNFFAAVGIAGSSFTFASSAVTPPLMSVWEANPMCEFRGQTKGAALGSSHVGLRKSLAWDSTLNVHYVDLTASTATDWRVMVTGIVENEGSSGGTVSFKFLMTQQGQQGSSVYVGTSTTPFLAFFG